MEGLMLNARMPAFGQAGPRLAWEARRLAAAISRRWGLWAPAMAVAAVLAALLGWNALENHQRAQALQARADVLAKLRPASPQRDRAQGPTEKLARFESHLLPQADIPAVLEDVLRLAEEEGLAIKRGDYRPQVDTLGRFMRYRMAVPVSGDAAMVRRFLRSALYRHKYIALESIEFKRERIETERIEARLHLIILARLPEATQAVPAGNNAKAGAK